MIHDYDLADDDNFEQNINWEELTYSYSKEKFDSNLALP